MDIMNSSTSTNRSQSSQSDNCCDDFIMFSDDDMDTTSYESLLATTKAGLLRDVTEKFEKDFFPFVINNCYNLIHQTLKRMQVLLTNETKVETIDLAKYLEETITVLKMFWNFLNGAIENKLLKSIHNCDDDSFPIATGNILLEVFTHCKKSELLYGSHLIPLERQLKDLFKASHDLQLVYLECLAKHVEFEEGCFSVLVKSLEINVAIGEIVQNLDLKTMAEHWKGIISICEEHAWHLMSENVFDHCCTCLIQMATQNLITAYQAKNDERIINRSLKVFNFAMKILTKISSVFKDSKTKNYDGIFSFIVNIVMIPHQTNTSWKHQQLLDRHVVNAASVLLKELMTDRWFPDELLHTMTEINNLEGERLLGNILLLIIIMDNIAVTTSVEEYGVTDMFPECRAECLGIPRAFLDQCSHISVNTIFNVLPKCYVLFGNSLKFPASPSMESCGFYEHLLTHTASYTATLRADQYSFVEESMFNAVLDVDCTKALFSVDLWLLLARFTPIELSTNQLISLSKIYKELEQHNLFAASPQRTYLEYLINGLFKTVDKMHVLKNIDIADESNAGLWAVMGVKNLPDGVRKEAEILVTSKLKCRLSSFVSGMPQTDAQIHTLISLMKMTSTCIVTSDCDLAELTASAWLSLCPDGNSQSILHHQVNLKNVWQFNYLEALVPLSEVMLRYFQGSALVKFLHILSKIMHSDNDECKLVAMKLLSTVANCAIDNKHKSIKDSILYEILKRGLSEENQTIQSKFVSTVRPLIGDPEIRTIVSKLDGRHFQDKARNLQIQLEDQLRKASTFDFIHKCLQNESVIELISSESEEFSQVSGNFDIADIDTLFDTESDVEQPASKKAKYSDEADAVLLRIENDINLLCKMKENVCQHKNRIRIVYEKLKNLVK